MYSYAWVEDFTFRLISHFFGREKCIDIQSELTYTHFTIISKLFPFYMSNSWEKSNQILMCFCFIVIECCFQQIIFMRNLGSIISKIKPHLGRSFSLYTPINDVVSKLNLLESVFMSIPILTKLNELPKIIRRLPKKNLRHSEIVEILRREPAFPRINILDDEVKLNSIRVFTVLAEYFNRIGKNEHSIYITKIISSASIVNVASLELAKFKKLKGNLSSYKSPNTRKRAHSSTNFIILSESEESSEVIIDYTPPNSEKKKTPSMNFANILRPYWNEASSLKISPVLHRGSSSFCILWRKDGFQPGRS